jgi:hypothetical protein
MVAARSIGLQNAVQTTLVRKAHEMDIAIADMISQSSQSPAPTGQGLKIDKLA